MGKLIGVGGTGKFGMGKMDLPEGLQSMRRQETTEEWLRRLNKELKAEMSGLRTKKIVGGKKKVVKVDHLPRLRMLAESGGIEAVQAYIDGTVKMYNEQLQQLKNKLNGHATR